MHGPRTASRSRGGRLLLCATCATVLVASACSNGGSDTRTTAATAREAPAAKVATFGLAPSVDPSITYQPDVVVVGGGADSIRSASADGLTWTIDGSASNVRELAPGKVMFLTGTAVGRVVAIEEDGDDVVVTLGPVDITDVVRDGHLETSQEIDLGAFALQTLPELPGSLELTESDIAPSPEESTSTSEGALGHVSLPMVPIAAVVPMDSWPPPTSGGGTQVTVGDFTLEVTKTSETAGRLGLKATYTKDGVALGLDFGVTFANAPTVVADLDIRSGRIVAGSARIDGLDTVVVKIDAGSEAGLAGNFSARIEVPVEANFRFMLGPVPMNLSFRQKLLVQTAFTAKNSTLSATGSYKIEGPLGFDYGSGGLQLTTPTVTTEESMIDTLTGVSVGVNGIVVAYQAKALIGVGVPLFTAGPFGAVTVSVGLTNGSDLGIVKCRRSSLDVVVAGGMGFTIGGGQSGTDHVTALLSRLAGSAPLKLDSEYSPKTATVVHEKFAAPNVGVCKS